MLGGAGQVHSQAGYLGPELHASPLVHSPVRKLSNASISMSATLFVTTPTTNHRPHATPYHRFPPSSSLLSSCGGIAVISSSQTYYTQRALSRLLTLGLHGGYSDRTGSTRRRSSPCGTGPRSCCGGASTTPCPPTCGKASGKHTRSRAAPMLWRWLIHTLHL